LEVTSGKEILAYYRSIEVSIKSGKESEKMGKAPGLKKKGR